MIITIINNISDVEDIKNWREVSHKWYSHFNTIVYQQKFKEYHEQLNHTIKLFSSLGVYVYNIIASRLRMSLIPNDHDIIRHFGWMEMFGNNINNLVIAIHELITKHSSFDLFDKYRTVYDSIYLEIADKNIDSPRIIINICESEIMSVQNHIINSFYQLRCINNFYHGLATCIRYNNFKEEQWTATYLDADIPSESEQDFFDEPDRIYSM